jgi:putative ABC transport system permease protein
MNGHGSAAIELGGLDLLLATGLVVIAGAVSLVLRLRIEKRLALAAVRTTVQLLLVGYVLRWVFEIQSPWLLAAVALLMVLAATQTAVKRPTRRFAGIGWRAFATLVSSGLLTTIVATALIVGVKPWYEPRYLIPLLGMVLGNSMNGISLCVDHLLETLAERRQLVEMELALGATRWEAAREPIAEAVRRGMIPIVNTMMVVGIVSLPGMMTGQILAGADPFEAVKYQIMIMFMLAAAVALGSMAMAILAYRRLFTPRHQLRADAIRRRAS